MQSWEPKPEEIIQLYAALEKKGILELEWQCPGRRSPSVHSGDSESFDRKPSDFDDAMNKRLELNEFDFEEMGTECTSSSPKITPRRKGAPGSGGQKRVARLDKVMFDIRRYRKLDEIEKKTQKMNLEEAASKSAAESVNEQQSTPVSK